MAYIDWNDSFSVQVTELDDHHKTLIVMINSLHQALMENRAREAQKRTIDQMISYAANHFATEENYMLKCNYPGYGKHKVEHEQFTAKALDLQGRMDKAGFVLTLEILHFLKDWLQDHILVLDKEYVGHINNSGLNCLS
jgi:hemerythrin